ncbi:hypothetical protein M427DRAFT_46623 [Gonapodya prolifera JEL478]|uniref:Uncharacterized protein n=1 Tax=Gonapodya prolifera (strain JEL478) TaxID=1344416 RepID=A0A139A5H4_GONPJ|nr:hypothetical protein M427DRAFT_46623 [Gonapodya prolifera JEL478]|eukprot:KXS12067.1 hypothetical protein M427DRAFT_46623 [Gonapodya prolifera JEL478]
MEVPSIPVPMGTSFTSIPDLPTKTSAAPHTTKVNSRAHSRISSNQVGSIGSISAAFQEDSLRYSEYARRDVFGKDSYIVDSYTTPPFVSRMVDGLPEFGKSFFYSTVEPNIVVPIVTSWNSAGIIGKMKIVAVSVVLLWLSGTLLLGNRSKGGCDNSMMRNELNALRRELHDVSTMKRDLGNLITKHAAMVKEFENANERTGLKEHGTGSAPVPKLPSYPTESISNAKTRNEYLINEMDSTVPSASPNIPKTVVSPPEQEPAVMTQSSAWDRVMQADINDVETAPNPQYTMPMIAAVLVIIFLCYGTDMGPKMMGSIDNLVSGQ